MLRQIMQQGSDTSNSVTQPGIASLKRRLFKVLVFFSLTTMIGWESLDEGFHFLFQIDKSSITEYEPTVSRSELWSMRQGTWYLVSLIAATIIAAITALKMLQLSRKPPNESPPVEEDER